MSTSYQYDLVVKANGRTRKVMYYGIANANSDFTKFSKRLGAGEYAEIVHKASGTVVKRVEG